MSKQANERVFEDVFFGCIGRHIESNPNLKFSKILQEENIGGDGKNRFADGILYSSVNTNIKILFELKRNSWDATDDVLVTDACFKAVGAGIEYYVTGTPRQLAIYKSLEAGKTIQERNKKIYPISTIRTDNEVLTAQYENNLIAKLKPFLKVLSDLVHGVAEPIWDALDRFYINKLSAFISDATNAMLPLMEIKIKESNELKRDLREYLKGQDIFNITQLFDSNDIYKLCQLANYLLYLKLLFYTDLQRNLPNLKLKPLHIPDDMQQLNQTLKFRFEDVLQHDFEMIFAPSVLDTFEIENNYLPTLRQNIDSLKNLDFSQLNADIIGSIYNTLIDNQEQHDRGQHFTNTDEVDIVNAFCIKPDTKLVMDSGCGAGTFLVRAYFFMKHHNPALTHEQLMERIWGIDIAQFPVFLATMNLCLLNIKCLDNYPTVISSDFKKITPKSSYTGYFLNVNKTFKVKKIDNRQREVPVPIFDSCVGNPPYIRQELIDKKEDWNSLIKNELGISKINQQSDLYVYYLMHTAAFLKEGGRLGYVISHSWLDTMFGKDLQKFLLDNFKIIAILSNQVKRSFETASINSVILIIEKCSETKKREKNMVRFVRVQKPFEEIIGNTWSDERFAKVNQFVDFIENVNKSLENKDLHIFTLSQKELESATTFDGKYENGRWGANYLRSPKIYEKLILKSSKNLIPVKNLTRVSYGIKSGSNEFFYLQDKTNEILGLDSSTYKTLFGKEKEKDISRWQTYGWYFSEMNNQHYIIEKIFTKPIFKSQKEATFLDIVPENLKYFTLFCNVDAKELKKSKSYISKYLAVGETNEIQNKPTILGRKPWYNLTNIAVVGDFIFPSVIGERFRFIDNRDSKLVCDKVNYVVKVREEYDEYQDFIFLIMNSTLFRFLIDLFSQQLTGALTVSAVDVNVLNRTLIPNPVLLKPYETELKSIYQSLKNREQGTIFEEVKQTDRRKLDEIIFRAIGMSPEDVDELYVEVCKYVNDRKQKSSSVDNTKKKEKYTHEQAIAFVKERFPEVRKYAELLVGKQTETYTLPTGKATFSKQNNGNGNAFSFYDVGFDDGENKSTLSFTNGEQLSLFEFLYRTLDFKNGEISLPKESKHLIEIRNILNNDFNHYAPQLKDLLKVHRIKFSDTMLYRALVL